MNRKHFTALLLAGLLILAGCAQKSPAGGEEDALARIRAKGEIVVAMIEDETTVKRLSLRGGKVWLLPENDGYSPIDGTYAKILGKVAAVVRHY